MYKITDLFDLNHTLADAYLARFEYPWQAIPGIGEWLWTLGDTLDERQFERRAPGVWVHKSASVAPSAWLDAPCVVDAGAQLRHGAFVRGGVLIGKNCVVGNSVELKNAILFDEAQVNHFNYVGDSLLGHLAHMGAGAITSNVKSNHTTVTLEDGGARVQTGLVKLGAMLGDRAEVGCNSVLNPGAVLGRDCIVYPLSCVRGTVPENHILKSGGVLVERRPQSEG